MGFVGGGGLVGCVWIGWLGFLTSYMSLRGRERWVVVAGFFYYYLFMVVVFFQTQRW